MKKWVARSHSGKASVQHLWESPNWPYECDASIVESTEARVWIAELEAAKAVALEVALTEARAKLVGVLADEAAKEAAAAEAKAKREERTPCYLIFRRT